jgi:hypothetical protein
MAGVVVVRLEKYGGHKLAAELKEAVHYFYNLEEPISEENEKELQDAFDCFPVHYKYMSDVIRCRWAQKADRLVREIHILRDKLGAPEDVTMAQPLFDRFPLDDCIDFSDDEDLVVAGEFLKPFRDEVDRRDAGKKMGG